MRQMTLIRMPVAYATQEDESFVPANICWRVSNCAGCRHNWRLKFHAHNVWRPTARSAIIAHKIVLGGEFEEGQRRSPSGAKAVSCCERIGVACRALLTDESPSS